MESTKLSPPDRQENAAEDVHADLHTKARITMHDIPREADESFAMRVGKLRRSGQPAILP